MSSETSYSSIESQKQLRIEKVDKLRARGVDPFPVTSHRDTTLDVVHFWFDIVFKGQYQQKIAELIKAYPDFFGSDIDPIGVEIELLENILDTDADYDSEISADQLDIELPDVELYVSYLNATRELVLDMRQYIDLEQLETKHIDRYISGYARSEIDILVRNIAHPHPVTYAGRIKSKRVSGKIAFATIEDQGCPSGFQFIFKKDSIAETEGGDILSFEDYKNLIDEGDFIQATGILNYSQRGEASLFVTEFKILTKSLRPLADTLNYDNTESRYLDRVADFKHNTIDETGLSVRKIMEYKALYWSIWREEMLAAGFLEVENPVFEHIPGGAEARPFTTYYNELEQEMYLRISLELPLKKLIAGGFEQVFEIGRIFRNEGSSPQHLQEYTMIEWYTAYKDYIWGAKFVKGVYQRIVLEILGSFEQIDYRGQTINWSEWCDSETAKEHGWQLIDGWPMIPYFEAVRHFSNGEIDTENKTEDELLEMCQNHDIDGVFKGVGMATLLDKLWKKARVNTTNPFYLILPPVELEPLAKRDPTNPILLSAGRL
jgi:lysyl-tRNA synthetase class II